MLHILSLGAGVQSTTMALMAAHGLITPMPDAAIFADTQWEPRAVYDQLAWLMSPNVLPFPVHIVSAGSLKDKVLSEGYSDVPWHTPGGMGRRQCTKAFKLTPVTKEAKRLAGVPVGERSRLRAGAIQMWVGISVDEAFRMKPARVRYIKNRWPLIEQRMTRNDCLRWLERNAYPLPPRSACLGCPYKSNNEWRHTAQDAAEWAETIAIDIAIRNLGHGDQTQYMHPSLTPLGEVDLSTAEDHGQINMFNQECEGMCGV